LGIVIVGREDVVDGRPVLILALTRVVVVDGDTDEGECEEEVACAGGTIFGVTGGAVGLVTVDAPFRNSSSSSASESFS
jgi:hypothetical protein